MNHSNTFKHTQNKREIKQQRKSLNKQLKEELQKLSLSDNQRNTRNSRRHIDIFNTSEPVVHTNIVSNEPCDAYIPSILTASSCTDKFRVQKNKFAVQKDIYRSYDPIDNIPNWYEDEVYTPDEIDRINENYYEVCEEEENNNMNFKHFDSLPTKDNKCNLYDVKKEGKSRDLYLRQIKAIKKYCKSQQKLAATFSSKNQVKKTVKSHKPTIRYIETIYEDNGYDEEDTN